MTQEEFQKLVLESLARQEDFNRKQDAFNREQQKVNREQQEVNREQQKVNREQQKVNREQQKVNREQQKVNRKSSDFQNFVLLSLTKQEEVNQRQEEFNCVVKQEFSDLRVFIENEVVDRLAGASDGLKVYTEQKIEEHELQFHHG